MSDSSGTAWGRVYQAIMRDPALSLGAKGLYAYFASFSDENGKCYPHTDVIREEIPLSNATYYKYLKELQDAQILTIEKVRRGNQFESNVYILQIPEQFKNCTTQKIEQFKNCTTEKQKIELHEQSKNCTTKHTIPTDYFLNRDNNMIDNADAEQEAAIEQICKILNSRRGKRNLKTSVGLWMLDKPPGGTWADLIPLARAFVGQYPKPEYSEDNNYTITWKQFSNFLKKGGTKK